MRLEWDGYQIQTETVATFLIIFKIHINFLFITKVTILVLKKWSCKPPPNYVNTFIQ